VGRNPAKQFPGLGIRYHYRLVANYRYQPLFNFICILEGSFEPSLLGCGASDLLIAWGGVAHYVEYLAFDGVGLLGGKHEGSRHIHHVHPGPSPRFELVVELDLVFTRIRGLEEVLKNVTTCPSVGSGASKAETRPHYNSPHPGVVDNLLFKFYPALKKA